MSVLCAARRAVFSSVAPEAFRALKHNRFFYSSLGSAFQNRCIHSALAAEFQNRCRKEIMKGTPWVSSREFTSESEIDTKSNEILVKELEDEIPGTLEWRLDPWEKEKIPWKIDGQTAVILRKKYGKEDIKVEATRVEGKENVEVTVTISKGEGPFLEFFATGHCCGFLIENVSFKHPQNKASDEVDSIPYETILNKDLDEGLNGGLWKALHEYLEVRGINLGLRYYLSDFLRKEGHEYADWLKAVKEYLEK